MLLLLLIIQGRVGCSCLYVVLLWFVFVYVFVFGLCVFIFFLPPSRLLHGYWYCYLFFFQRERDWVNEEGEREEREGGLNTLESVICVPDEVYKQRPPVGMVQR